MGYEARNLARLAYWNLWPALRLILVLAALGFWAHRSLGLNLPSAHRWVEVAGGLTILFVVTAMLFWPLARLGLALLWYPFYVVVVFNWLFYGESRLMVRQIIGPRSQCLEAGLALAGEIGLFMSLAQPIALLLKAHGHF
jgi:hypothetical protein